MLVISHHGAPAKVHARGFTIVELMVAVGVFAILTALAVPSFREFIARQRLRAASFDLRTDLILARSEALKRNQNITIRRRDAAGWQTGWVVVVDGTDDPPLRERNPPGTGVGVDSPADEITFNGSGRVMAPAGTVQIGLTAAAGSIHFDRCVVLSPSGMPTTYSEACT